MFFSVSKSLRLNEQQCITLATVGIGMDWEKSSKNIFGIFQSRQVSFFNLELYQVSSITYQVTSIDFGNSLLVKTF